MARRGRAIGMRDGYLRGALSQSATRRQLDVLAAYVAAGGSVPDAAALVGIRPSTAKRHLADLRARSGLTTAQLIYVGRAAGWLVVPSLLRDWHLAEDALQHTLVTIWNELPRLRDPDRFEAWTYRLIARESVSAARREVRGGPVVRLLADDADALVAPDQYRRWPTATSSNAAFAAWSPRHGL